MEGPVALPLESSAPSHKQTLALTAVALGRPCPF